MAHWRALLPGQMFELDYETLVNDQEQQTRRLLDYCGLPWQEACLSFHQTRRQVITASASQVHQPLYGSSIARWKRYEAQLPPLRAILQS